MTASAACAIDAKHFEGKSGLVLLPRTVHACDLNPATIRCVNSFRTLSSHFSLTTAKYDLNHKPLIYNTSYEHIIAVLSSVPCSCLCKKNLALQHS